MRPIVLAVALAAGSVLPLCAEDRRPHPPRHEAPEERSGTVKGVVTETEAKGIFTIRTPQGQRTFTPPWRGGMPADGGGLDPEIVKQVQALTPGDIVEVAWEWEERPRAIKIRVIGREPGDRAEKREERQAKRDERAGKDAPHEGRPEAKPPEPPAAPQHEAGATGKVRGTVASVDPKGRFVVTTSDGKEEAFMAHWRGGMPADGGGLDKVMVAQIAALSRGQQVEVDWEFQERKRCVKVVVVGGK